MPAGLTSRWGWYWVRGFPDPGRAPKCKTQNSGLRSKEGKPRDPMNQPSRCNTQEGLLTVAQTGDSDLLANWASFYGQKTHIISILHTGYKVIGYMFTKQFYWYNFAGFGSNLKQFYWYKRRGLLFKLRRPRAFQLSRGLLLGAY